MSILKINFVIEDKMRIIQSPSELANLMLVINLARSGGIALLNQVDYI